MSKRHWTNAISELFGAIARTRFPGPLQRLINGMYVYSMRIDLSDFKKPAEYESLDALFTRKLEKERRLDADANLIISPADSLVTELGRLDKDVLLQIKGMEYSVRDLLTADARFVDDMMDGDYINFYLSPRDYHRYHAPTTLSVSRLIHVPGKLFPVNLPSLRRRNNLFPRNERVVLECRHESGGVLYLVFVGATMVGSMTFGFEQGVRTNTPSGSITVYDYEDNRIEKGDCIGCFHMGSSIVMVSQKGFLEIGKILNRKVKYGDAVASVAIDST